MASRIRRGDEVVVIAGAHKGERGKVLRVDQEKGKVVVEGVNMVYRHVKPSRRNPQGGRLQKEAALHISNVLPFDSKTNRGARVHFDVKRDESGKVTLKRRVTGSGTVLSEVSKSGK